MERGINNNVKDNSKIITLLDVSIIYLCLFQKIKCAIVCCMFDFFYLLKEKHCRSPPLINSNKTELIGGKNNMQYEVDTYKLEYIEETGQYYICFKDSVENDCRIEISKDIFEAYITSKKSYIKVKNQKDRHEEPGNLTEEDIYMRSIDKEKGTEDKAIANIYKQQLKNAKKALTESQKRRIELNIETGISIRELAKRENVRKNQIEKSITLGLKKLKNFFEN